jgi:aryl-alcohol dehydrogenase-like predicted oxidoreductase
MYMQTRRIGSLEVTVVGLGCNNFGWRLDPAAAKRVIDTALDSGINFFDTADIYGQGQSEDYIARALGDRRKQVIIATKFAKKMDQQGRGAHPDYIRTAVDASLRRLHTDYIDLYQQHEPDPSIPIADTLGALDDLVKVGKVREIGCSNFSVQQLQEAERAVRPGAARFVSVQNEYSLLHREPELGVLDECMRLSLSFLPFFPLASGLLTGKYRLGQPLPEGSRIKNTNDKDLEVVESLIEFAESRGHTILELAFSWLLAQPTVASVIAGATKPEQIHANVAAADWQLSVDDLAEIDRCTQRTAER